MKKREPGGKNEFLNPGEPGTHGGPEAIQEPRPSKDDSPGLYVHIPFCLRVCPYCDFAVRPMRGGAETADYVRALETEMRFHDEQGGCSRTLKSVFLGGGTPSALPPNLLAAILDGVRREFTLQPGAEVTLEINPENVTERSARQWRTLGITRASLGVQSLDDAELRRLGRLHTPEQAADAFRVCRNAGIPALSVDLIFGLEDQTVGSWTRTLQTVLGWNPDHVSAYNLTIEKRTRYGSESARNLLHLPSEETQVEMFQTGRRILQDAGLLPYEISNFAKPGSESRHNLIYWTGGQYRGIGMSAHSFRRTAGEFERSWNPRKFRDWLDPLRAGRPPARETERLSPARHWGERLMTGLRLTSGVDPGEIESDLGEPPSGEILNEIERFIGTGHLARRGHRLALTERGILLSDSVFETLQPLPGNWTFPPNLGT